MSYFTTIDNYMASPINDKEHYTRRYYTRREHFTSQQAAAHGST